MQVMFRSLRASDFAHVNSLNGLTRISILQENIYESRLVILSAG